MTNVTTQLLVPDAAGIVHAAEMLAAGQLVAFPTETVYGLGADARNQQAVLGIYAAKGRPSFNPLIVHVANLNAAEEMVEFSQMARNMAQAFWPGPLTLVLPLKPGAGLADAVTAGLPTLAIRVPQNQAACDLLHRFGGPVAAPSANLSGKVSPTSAAHVLDGLEGRISAVLDAGICDVGLESTIIGFDPEPTLLRPGGLPAEAIEASLGQPLRGAPDPGEAINAPGQLASHYAPDAALRLNAQAPAQGEVMLGFGSVVGELTLSASGDLHEAACNLFSMLRQLDRAGTRRIAVAPIPDIGLGKAINDRLQRAAAPRD